MLQFHDYLLEPIDKLALQWFSEEITNHLLRGTVCNGEFIVVDAVGDKIESAVEMFGAFAA